LIDMNVDRITEKLNILADAAKYDVSCASSGSKRKNENKGLGNASNGICHSYTEDGRCVSLLKILLTNHCIFDCAYCVSRKNNDIKRAASPCRKWLTSPLTFTAVIISRACSLSSGIFKDADYTMERWCALPKSCVPNITLTAISTSNLSPAPAMS
jgi:predicted DNA-binding helix-hairpin-helix protein